MESKALAERLVGAIGERDWAAVEGCLATQVRFRALLPERLREHETASETAERMRLWWSDADVFELVSSDVDEVADRVHLTYRIRCRENGNWFLVEQQGVAVVEQDRITDLSLVCTGFRPIDR